MTTKAQCLHVQPLSLLQLRIVRSAGKPVQRKKKTYISFNMWFLSSLIPKPHLPVSVHMGVQLNDFNTHNRRIKYKDGSQDPLRTDSRALPRNNTRIIPRTGSKSTKTLGWTLLVHSETVDTFQWRSDAEVLESIAEIVERYDY